MDVSLKLYFTIFVLVVLLLVAFAFGSQNDQLITLNYFIAKATMPVAMAVSIFAGLGFLFGLVFMFLINLLKPLKRKQNKG
ncbi:lipopolysaccharide assembly protein LapA domain-containing protein [Thalassotalea euphylliae]|uniref:LapA family protein n=1 Tax=Thalassotalea euphylliae TaxID=1655234 RepID=A0A3E0UEQ8_9GAMM|nr:LapA family protein [Thalassotalea euphylliae]REL35340.1 LapA family protein [Thalassotalea euphylliae]